MNAILLRNGRNFCHFGRSRAESWNPAVLSFISYAMIMDPFIHPAIEENIDHGFASQK